MSISWLTHLLLGSVLLPPLSLLILAGLAILVSGRHAWFRRLALACLVLLAILATPWVGSHLLAMWQTPYRPLSAGMADAIVVLGGGVYEGAPEYGGDTVAPFVLERLRYAARLHREFGKPILVTGGRPSGGNPEAPLMKVVLEHDFKVPVRWVEPSSNDTEENALYSAAMLKPLGIRRVFVVSQAWHLPRAMVWFRAAGMEPVPAGTGFEGYERITPYSFVPNGYGLLMSYIASREALGMFWYWLRH